MNLFFDSETSGFYDNTKSLDDPKQGRLMELACVLATAQGEIVDEYYTLIKPPPGIVLSEGAFKAHGISLERAEAEGVPLDEALGRFSKFCNSADEGLGLGRLIAHNLRFDMGIMLSEYKRIPLENPYLGLLQPFCTMLALTDIIKIPGKYGRNKWPSLMESYRYFFDADFTGAHSALGDTQALFRLYNEAVKMEVFKP